MKKSFKWIGVGVGAAILIAVLVSQWLIHDTKRHSPSDTVVYSANGKEIQIDYCRPFKKDREIFGGLVPYGEVWRTGANEATTFITTADLQIQDQELPAGEYTLWTIPGPDEWEIIINSGKYRWGVQANGKASRESELDVVRATVPVRELNEPIEQFTIELKAANDVVLNLRWDDVGVALPMQWKD